MSRTKRYIPHDYRKHFCMGPRDHTFYGRDGSKNTSVLYDCTMNKDTYTRNAARKYKACLTRRNRAMMKSSLYAVLKYLEDEG